MKIGFLKKLKFKRDLTRGNNLPTTSLEVVFYVLVFGFFILAGVVAFINVSIDKIVDDEAKII